MIEETANNQVRKPRSLMFGTGAIFLFLVSAALIPSPVRLNYGMAIVFLPSLLAAIGYLVLRRRLVLRLNLGLIVAVCYALVHWASNDRLLIFVTLSWLAVVWVDWWRNLEQD